MLSERTTESIVGLFLLAGILALIILAFKVSGLTTFFQPKGYDVYAKFENIGQLKVRAPVKIGGVLIGEVTGISLDPVTYKALVRLHIDANFNDIPNDSSVSILTAGLLGDNYLEISPMYSTVFLKQGDELADTHSAMILEKLIGQLIYKISNPGNNSSNNNSSNTASNNASSNTEQSTVEKKAEPAKTPKKIPDPEIRNEQI